MKPFAWSYSALTAYEQCPHRFAQTRIYKTVKEVEGEQMIYGQQVHKALENRIRFRTPLPAHLRHMEATLDKLEHVGRCVAEERYGLDRAFHLTDYFDKPTTMPDRRVWLRIVLDLQVLPNPQVAIVVDHKTGKVKDDLDQLKLFAASMFSLHPKLEEVRTGYWWTAQNQLTTETFHRDEAPIIWQEFMPRVKRMEANYKSEDWQKRPSGLCKKHCPVTTCPFYGVGP